MRLGVVDPSADLVADGEAVTVRLGGSEGEARAVGVVVFVIVDVRVVV